MAKIISFFMAAFQILCAVLMPFARMDVSIISDTHFEQAWHDTENNTQSKLKAGFNDKILSKSDALVISGDLIQAEVIDGKAWYLEEFIEFRSFLKENCRNKNVIMAMGNHDSWSNFPHLFIDTQKAYTPGIENPYYSCKVNGYTFVVLGGENGETAEGGDGIRYGSRDNLFISQAQLAWFDETLKQATEKGLPAFVVCHNPINGTNGINEVLPIDPRGITAASIGNQSDEVLSIMRKHSERATVFYISGHIHTSNKITQDGDNSLYFVNISSFGQGPVEIGSGYNVKLYPNRAEFRIRDFVNGKWLAEKQVIYLK